MRLHVCIIFICYYSLKVKLKRPEASEISDPFEDELEENHTRRHKSFRTTSVHIGDSQSLFSFSLPRRLTRRHFARNNKPTNRKNVISMIDLDNGGGEPVLNVNPRMNSMPEQSSQQKSGQECNSVSSNSNTRPVLSAQQKSNTLDLNPAPEMKATHDRQRNRSRSEDNVMSSRSGSATIYKRETKSVPPDLLKPLLDCSQFSDGTGGDQNTKKKSDAQMQAVNILSIYLNTEEEFTED